MTARNRLQMVELGGSYYSTDLNLDKIDNEEMMERDLLLRGPPRGPLNILDEE